MAFSSCCFCGCAVAGGDTFNRGVAGELDWGVGTLLEPLQLGQLIVLPQDSGRTLSDFWQYGQLNLKSDM